MAQERYDKVTLQNDSINSGVAVTIPCTVVTPSGSKNIINKPEANGSQMAKVQTQSFENLVYTIGGIYYTGESNTLTYDHVLTLYKQAFDDTNASTLTITHGKDTGTAVKGLGGSTSIKVILKTFSYPLDQSKSDRAYRPVGTLTFVETREG